MLYLICGCVDKVLPFNITSTSLLHSVYRGLATSGQHSGTRATISTSCTLIKTTTALIFCTFVNTLHINSYPLLQVSLCATPLLFFLLLSIFSVCYFLLYAPHLLQMYQFIRSNLLYTQNVIDTQVYSNQHKCIFPFLIMIFYLFLRYNF